MYKRQPLHLSQRIGIHARRASTSWVFHLLVSGLVLVVVFMNPPLIFRGDTDTARNYLNTIVSSLSTILALCISIILVAIQMTAGNYTHRVLDFFVRLPYNASLFFVYLATIMHSFYLMARIKDPVRENLPMSLQLEMSADLVLVMICFVSLLIYMYAVIQLLKPERIITLILRDYDRALSRGKWRAALDNVEQICDIAKRASSVSDSVTGMRCIEAMLQIGFDLPLPAHRRDTLLEIHQSLVDQWVEIAGVSVKEKETGLLYGGLNALRRQGQYYIEGEAWAAAEVVIKAFRHLVFSHLLSEGQLFYAERVADRMFELAACAVQAGERGRQFCLRTWQVIRSIGENVFSGEPAGAPSLIEGFLMPKELAASFDALLKGDQWSSGLVVYFGLWKAFASACDIRDAARWAVWWQDNMDDSEYKKHGQSLAVFLCHHVHREDVAQTLQYVWNLSLAETKLAPSKWLEEASIDLFDGWPWPGNVASQRETGNAHLAPTDIE